MAKFEYKIFNMSEANQHNENHPNDKKTWLDMLNQHGRDGWQMKTPITRNSFLLMREAPAPMPTVGVPGITSPL